MTTDTTALEERLWDAIAEARDGGERTAHDVDSYDIVEAILPIIAAEVRKAKAEALRSAARDIEASDRHLPGMAVRDVYRGLRFRADDMETGGQA